MSMSNVEPNLLSIQPLEKVEPNLLSIQPLEKVEPNLLSKVEPNLLSKVESLSPPFSKVDVKVVVEALGEKYSFDAEEALRWLSEENICELSMSKSTVKKSKAKKPKDLAPPLSKVVEKVEKRKYPLPFNGLKNDNCCNGIVKNHGLYTQCEKKLPKDGKYCKVCDLEPYGNIEDRLKVDLYEYKDPKGNGPIRYTEVLKKLKISKEMIEEESKRLKITISEVHFEEVVSENAVKRGRPKSEKVKESKESKSTGKKGRPKKESKKVEVTNYSEEEDLFASLLASISLENQVQPLENQPLEKVEPNEEDLEEDLEKSKSKLAPKELVEDLKKQRKAEDKAVKEAEKLMKAEAKEADKQKKAEEKAAKEAAKESKKKTPKVDSKETSKDLAPPLSKVDEEEVPDVVKKFEFGGKKYYKSTKCDVIYNMDQEVVGKWNEERKEIDFEEEEEEEEEEYDD